MKKKITLVLLAATLISVGCSDDDDNGNNAFEGQWHVVKVGNGFAGPPDEFEEGEITWRFRSNNQIVVSKTDEIFPGPDNGTHTYAIEPWEQMCDESLYINEVNYGCIELEGDTLKFMASAVDGPDYVLVR